MVAERRYRSASGAPILASGIFSSRPKAMAHPMFRGAQAAATGGAAIRAASAGLIGVSVIGETAIQIGNWCPRRRPGTPRNRLDNVLSIHSNTPNGSMELALMDQAQLSTIAAAIVNHHNDARLAQNQAQSSAIAAAIASNHHNGPLVPAIDRNETAKLQNIICQQSTDTSKLLGIIEDLNNKINDMQQHMSQDLARTEEKLRAMYDNMLVNAIVRINEEKDGQINFLKMQVAKFRGEEKTDEEVKKELQFQNQVYPQSPDQATRRVEDT